jgi:deoxycytidine triphosphate deaminase
MMAEIVNRWMLVDPEPDVRGILLSDRIEAYVKKYRLLIAAHDFKETNLKPASYSLTLGAKYYCNGETAEIKRGEYLVVPPNSFVIAGIEEQVVLPHWCAARFGLRVAYVYKGLLMGAGPQVDPGFEGYLGCPLHNLTNRPVRIKRGEPLAWIDFAKTSRLGDNSALANEEALLEAARRREKDRYEKRAWVVQGFQGFDCRLYETLRLSFENSLPPGETIASSVKGLEDSVNAIAGDWKVTKEDMTGEIKRLTTVSRRINVASVVALAALFITVMLTIGVEVWMPRRAAMIELQQRIETLDGRIAELRSVAPTGVPTPGSATQPKSSPKKPPI